ncbi:MAG TPA: LLM class flavin-dependent oxidoreductase [Gemmatimonadaceae bacterium]|jgi:probable LLM family oxidoreductase
MTSPPLELGLDTFGDVSAGPDGAPLSHAQVIRNVIAEAVLADSLGVDFIGLGEHHREDFAISSPDVVLAAIAGQTKRIRLGSAVTVLSSDDPVRVFQRFATLDAASNGRAEIILGRGSFTESFPLFGYPLSQYEVLFEQKLDLFDALLDYNRTHHPVTWEGTMRAPLTDQRVFPVTESGELMTWIGVGGSVESMVRAAGFGMPVMLAIIGGDPRRFLQHVRMYRHTFDPSGETGLPLGVHSPGHIADTDEQARDELWPAYKVMHDKIGRERGWPPLHRATFEQEAEQGSLYVGSSETVAQKIAATSRVLELSRFDLKYSCGPLSHERMMHCIELYGRVVIPRVRELLAPA